MVNRLLSVTCPSTNQPSACCVWLKLDFLACGESALEEEAGGVGHFPT